MAYVVQGSQLKLIRSFYLPIGTYTLRTRLGPITGVGIVTATLREAGSFTDVATTSAASQVSEDTAAVVVGVDAWYQLYADITTGIGILGADIL